MFSGQGDIYLFRKFYFLTFTLIIKRGEIHEKLFLCQTQKMKEKTKISIKIIAKDVLNNSTAQAICRITQTPHLTVKVFLFLCVIGSSGMSSYFVIKSIVNYFNFEVNTITRKLFETPAEFPKVTLCNINQFTTEYALEFLKQINHNISPNASIFDGKNMNKYQKQIKIREINSLATANMLDQSVPNTHKAKFAHSIDDILLKCKFNNEHCTAKDFEWILDRQFGNCYVFNAHSNNSRKLTISGPGNGLKLTLYSSFHDNLTVFNSYTGGNGFILRIENNSYLTDHNADGIYISPGIIANIAVERTFRLNLPEPYSNCDLDNASPRDYQSDLYEKILNSQYEYSQQFCLNQCIQKQIISICNCSYPFMLSLFEADQCNNQAQIICSSNVYTRTTNATNTFIQDNCMPLCPLECNSTEYHSSLTFLQMIGDYHADILKQKPNLLRDFVAKTLNARTAQESTVVLNIFYDSLSYTKSFEIAQMDLVALMSNIGGTMSLFMGVSLFSMFEMAEAFLEGMAFLVHPQNKVKYMT